MACEKTFSHLGERLVTVDAPSEFFAALAGIEEPKAKRKAIVKMIPRLALAGTAKQTFIMVQIMVSSPIGSGLRQNTMRCFSADSEREGETMHLMAEDIHRFVEISAMIVRRLEVELGNQDGCQ